jgi:hypothetical protein
VNKIVSEIVRAASILHVPVESLVCPSPSPCMGFACQVQGSGFPRGLRVGQAFKAPLYTILQIADWSRAQGRNIHDQLLDGIRYLDLRVVWDGVYTEHATSQRPLA